MLAPLGDYGGPTRTMPPLPGSPAIDAALVDPLITTGQRGFARPNGPLPDIGAAEAYPLAGAPGFVDEDLDGIDDRLETGIFGDTMTASATSDTDCDAGPGARPVAGRDMTASATSDTDCDGSTDAEEIGNMTNPLDPNDHFRILSSGKPPVFDPQTNPVFNLTISTFPGLDYRCEHGSTLGGSWAPLGDPFTADDFTTTVQVLLDPGRDFVRAVRE